MRSRSHAGANARDRPRARRRLRVWLGVLALMLPSLAASPPSPSGESAARPPLGEEPQFGAVDSATPSGSVIDRSAAKAVHAALLEAQLAPERAVELRRLPLDLGLARLNVDQGVLIPAITDDGSVVEAVFVGQARFRAEPPDRIEAQQLELFTGRRSVDTPVDEVVLSIADAARVRRLFDRPAPLDLRPELITRAQSIYEDWRTRIERRTTGVEAAMFAHRLGDPLFDGYVAVWARSYELGDFVYQVDPEEEEQVTVGRFTRLGVAGWDRLRLRRHLRLQQRKGRWLGVGVDDLGAWDVWMSARWEDATTTVPRGQSAGFEVEHYDIDLTIRRDKLRVEGATRLHLRAQAAGRRIVRLKLYRDLVVRSIRDQAGRSLYWFRADGDVVVALAEPSLVGGSLQLDVEFEGQVLRWAGPKTWDLEDTVNWHPHCGQIDRATYDVTLRWPRRFELVGAGKVVESGEQGKYRWARRRVDHPTIAFAFALGRFVRERATVDGVTFDVAFARDSDLRSTGPATRQTLENLIDAFDFFESSFGDYPLDYVNVAVIPRGYSQSFLGYITLSSSILQGSAAREGRPQVLRRDLTLSHELAHLWWGNLVGWWGYRDQWLSEAMANYAALVYLTQRDGSELHLGDLSAGWRESLGGRTPDGRVIESLGPVVLGQRLNSSVAGNGYRPIVYRKGAGVLAMLARMVGPDPFLGMLRELNLAARGKVLTTDAFLHSVERMSGRDLQAFADRFVFGTGIPQVYYDYELVQDAARGWRVQGTARVLGEPHYRFEVRAAADGWEVLREHAPMRPIPPAAMTVPFSIEGENRWSARRGQWDLVGPTVPFDLEAGQQAPRRFRLDPDGEIFARFYPRDDFPKRFARYVGQDRWLAGDRQGAEQAWLEALASPVAEASLIDGQPWVRSAEVRRRSQDARIRLDLARLYLEAGRHASARGHLDAVDALFENEAELYEMERDVLRARLELIDGDAPSALRRLKKTLRRAAPERSPTGWRARLWRLRLNTERTAMTEAYALVAVIAAGLDEPEELQWALGEASDRGVELGDFRQSLGQETPDGALAEQR